MSTIAAATSGRRLPTEQVVRAFAVTCGADPETWAARLRWAAKAQASGLHAADRASSLEDRPGAPDAGATGGTGRGWFRSPPGRARRLVPAAAAAVVLAVGMYAVGALTAKQPPTPQVTGGISAAGAIQHTYPALDGTDPIAGGCIGDHRLVDKSPLVQNGVTIGALELFYSPLCNAGWARVYLYPAGVTSWNGALASVQVAAADGTASMFAARLNRQVPNFTDVVQPHGGCLLATAVLGVGTAAPIRASITCDTV